MLSLWKQANNAVGIYRLAFAAVVVVMITSYSYSADGSTEFHHQEVTDGNVNLNFVSCMGRSMTTHTFGIVAHVPISRHVNQQLVQILAELLDCCFRNGGTARVSKVFEKKRN